MRMIMISPSQLKVMMDAEDMRRYEIDCDDCLEPRTRRSALRRILRRAKEETGFSSDGVRVLVRMFPSKDGGCEMFVTRLGRADENAVADGMRAYSFGSLSELICACRALKTGEDADKSFAYRDETREAWYLVIGHTSPVVSEMGGVLLKPGAIAYINEYCTLICRNAVSTLAEYA